MRSLEEMAREDDVQRVIAIRGRGAAVGMPLAQGAPGIRLSNPAGALIDAAIAVGAVQAEEA